MKLLREGYPVKRVCIIGGTGKVGQTLVSFLRTANELSIVFYAESYEQECKLRASFQDNLVDFEICRSPQAIQKADTIILIAGKRTSRGSGKSDLYQLNKEVIDPYLDFLNHKNVILVTNPTTLLGTYLGQRLDAFIVGVGVQNDFNRLKFQCPHVDFVMGAHNLNEQCYFNNSQQLLFDGFKSTKVYSEARSQQDDYVSSGDFEKLHSTFLENDIHKWWKIQRYHTVVNSSSYSCALAIMQTLSNLNENIHSVIHAEVCVVTPSGSTYFIGVPLLGKNLRCTDTCLMQFIDMHLDQLSNYKVA
ncbi:MULTISPECIES: hypothetical protein [unclassified Pseudomonas]|uniref:hypothetical protein n=1 Tax=unclassified Pseudomonas TaxID=196821 RepID=UPI0008712059|nr:MULTISPECIES: hypothetical protein [unclassified Pseudomonas]SCW36555.1 Semialdehyde dehydrogenase, NAD binding domain [Pseudomonas sp. NFACC05-1]SDW57572.1 Semialdehyde dehydrogenase, NAD binding domain [Pseudomonas sp. NFACC08-1]